MGYTKLFSQILMSTVWRSPNHIRLVWITMLAAADENGEVRGSVPGLADFARVTREQCDEALEAFLSPDADSTNRDNEGRRVAVIPGGWKLLNYHIYRDLMSLEDRRERDAARQRRFRQGRMSRSVTQSPQVTTTEQNRTEQNRDPSGKVPLASRAHALPDDWAPPRTEAVLTLERGVASLQLEREKFRDWARNAKPKKDWTAAWRNWLRETARRERLANRGKPAPEKTFEEAMRGSR